MLRNGRTRPPLRDDSLILIMPRSRKRLFWGYLNSEEEINIFRNFLTIVNKEQKVGHSMAAVLYENDSLGKCSLVPETTSWPRPRSGMHLEIHREYEKLEHSSDDSTRQLVALTSCS